MATATSLRHLYTTHWASSALFSCSCEPVSTPPKPALQGLIKGQACTTWWPHVCHASLNYTPHSDNVQKSSKTLSMMYSRFFLIEGRIHLIWTESITTHCTQYLLPKWVDLMLQLISVNKQRRNSGKKTQSSVQESTQQSSSLLCWFQGFLGPSAWLHSALQPLLLLTGNWLSTGAWRMSDRETIPSVLERSSTITNI